MIELGKASGVPVIELGKTSGVPVIELRRASGIPTPRICICRGHCADTRVQVQPRMATIKYARRETH